MPPMMMMMMMMMMMIVRAPPRRRRRGATAEYRPATLPARSVADNGTSGLRLWATVFLARYVAFWLQLDNAHGAALPRQTLARNLSPPAARPSPVRRRCSINGVVRKQWLLELTNGRFAPQKLPLAERRQAENGPSNADTPCDLTHLSIIDRS